MYWNIEVTPEDEAEMIGKIAQKIHKNGLDIVAVLTMESIKPLSARKRLMADMIFSINSSLFIQVTTSQVKPGNLPSDLLTDLDVNLSAHPAPTVQPMASGLFASDKINMALFVILGQANILPGVYVLEAFYISALPI